MANLRTYTTNMKAWQEPKWTIVPYNIPVSVIDPPSPLMEIGPWKRQYFELPDRFEVVDPREDVERFRKLVASWRQERELTSSISEMVEHPAYQQIIAMGREAIPLLLRELERYPDHWFWALKAITGEDPVPPASRGNVRQMTEAWLSWGRARGHLSQDVAR